MSKVRTAYLDEVDLSQDGVIVVGLKDLKYSFIVDCERYEIAIDAYHSMDYKNLCRCTTVYIDPGTLPFHWMHLVSWLVSQASNGLQDLLGALGQLRIDLFMNRYGKFESSADLSGMNRLRIYLDVQLNSVDAIHLETQAKLNGVFLTLIDQTRMELIRERSKAKFFISYDHRDRETIAEPLARSISAEIGSVWFDKFALRPGDDIRVSIEKGLQESERCLLIVTAHLLDNNSWAREELSAFFSRQVAEKRPILIPVWFDVTEAEVRRWSPFLASKFAVVSKGDLRSVVDHLKEI